MSLFESASSCDPQRMPDAVSAVDNWQRAAEIRLPVALRRRLANDHRLVTAIGSSLSKPSAG